MQAFFGGPPTVTPACLPYWPVDETFGRKVKVKLNQLRKKFPDVPPANLGGIKAARSILEERTALGQWHLGAAVGAGEHFGIYFEDGPVTWVFRPTGSFWSMRINRGWQP